MILLGFLARSAISRLLREVCNSLRPPFGRHLMVK